MPKSFVEQALARCSVTGSKLWFNCNPDSSEHWFYKEWVDGTSDKTKQKNRLHLHFTMDDNYSLADSVKQRYERMYSGVFYDRYIKGLWVLAEGLVYPMFDRIKHTKIPEQLPNGKYYISVDYGTLNAFSAGLWLYDKRIAYRIAEFYYSGRTEQKQLTNSQYAEKIRKLAGNRKIESVIVDPSAASFIEELRQNGFLVRKGKNDVVDGIRRTATMLAQNRIFISPDCKNILKEFMLYRWDSKSGQDSVIKENDHAMDDMRYFVNTIMREGIKIQGIQGGF